MFGQLVAATVKDMVRDRMTLFWFFALPVILIFIYGFIFSGSTAAHKATISAWW